MSIIFCNKKKLLELLVCCQSVRQCNVHRASQMSNVSHIVNVHANSQATHTHTHRLSALNSMHSSSPQNVRKRSFDRLWKCLFIVIFPWNACLHAVLTAHTCTIENHLWAKLTNGRINFVFLSTGYILWVWLFIMIFISTYTFDICFFPTFAELASTLLFANILN